MKIERILIVRSDRFGEFLLSLPAIKLIKTHFPKSTVYLFAQKANIGLISDIEFIDRFIEYREGNFSGLKGSFRLAAILRKERIDCLLALNSKKEFHFAAYLAGVCLRVGYDRKWGFCLNKKLKDLKYLAKKHEVEYNIELAGLICDNSFIPKINLPVDSRDSLSHLEDRIDISSNYIVLHPFSSNNLKIIEDDFWLELISRFRKLWGNEIVFIGSQAEQPRAEILAKKAGIITIAGKLSLRNLATFFKYNTKAFVGLDSGPMHLAALVNLPTVGLFKISDSRRWGPFGSNSLAISGSLRAGFMQRIDDIVSFINEREEKTKLLQRS